METTLSALATIQEKQESLKQYYRRLWAAYFQGYNAPELEEEPAFKSFLHNLHETIRYSVIVLCKPRKLNMQEIRKYAQVLWEIHAGPAREPVNNAGVWWLKH